MEFGGAGLDKNKIKGKFSCTKMFKLATLNKVLLIADEAPP